MKHLTDDALMLLAGRRLSGEARGAVERHLEECADCRERYDSLEVAHSVFERLSEIGLSEVAALASQAPPPRRRREFAFPWGPVTAIVAGCVLVLAFLFYPKTVQPVSASELLTSAIRSETQSTTPAAFRLHIGGTACGRGRSAEQLVSLEKSASCHHALQRIKQTRWGRGNPLSARTFQAWHDTLPHRSDMVDKDQTAWHLKTSTDDGPVHAASLQVRVADYHATELTLQFDDQEELTVSEDLESSPTLPPGPDVVKTTTTRPEVKYVDDPGDLMEVRAWTALYKLGADSGWEALAVRDGGRVVVGGIVGDVARQQEIASALGEADPKIEVTLHTSATATPEDRALFPERDFGVAAPPLAEDWLEQTYPAPSERSAFASHVSEISRSLLGRAFVYDKLRTRSQALHRCSCAKDLDPILLAEREHIGSLQQDLASALAPVIGGTSDSRPTKLLTYREAVELDKLARNTFTAQSDSTITLSAALSGLRAGLSRR